MMEFQSKPKTRVLWLGELSKFTKLLHMPDKWQIFVQLAIMGV